MLPPHAVAAVTGPPLSNLPSPEHTHVPSEFTLPAPGPSESPLRRRRTMRRRSPSCMPPAADATSHSPAHTRRRHFFNWRKTRRGTCCRLQSPPTKLWASSSPGAAAIANAQMPGKDAHALPLSPKLVPSSSPAPATATEIARLYLFRCRVCGGGHGASGRALALPQRPVSERSSATEAPILAVDKVPLRRALLRVPSMPVPRIGREKPAQECVCVRRSGGDSGKKLRHTHSNLEGGFLLSPGGRRKHLFSCCCSSSFKSADRDRALGGAKLENIIRYVAGHHRAITGGHRRETVHAKKWRSLSDMEAEEAQGLRDLGFVFDGRSEAPGAREAAMDNRGLEGTKAVSGRSCVPEAWLAQRSAPPVLDWVGGGSAADVKEQLRFWAQVVASSVHQEC